MRVCVFVDGENFRHSIVDLYPLFRQEHYLPKSANWTALFDWIVQETVPGGERLRTYWYTIEKVDYYPYSFPDPLRSTSDSYRLLSKHEPYKIELDALDDAHRQTRLIEITTEMKRRRETFQNRFDGWMAIQDGISSRHRAIEFRRAGCMKCELFTNVLGREKAVDVKLATDMITLEDIYDVGIIVSGDQDYVPAVEVIKDCGKRIVNVSFLTRSGKLLPGGARRLNQVTDWHYHVEYQPLADHLGIRT